MSEEPPAEVHDLVSERTAARAARDFARADDLRGRIRDLGWEVMDSPQGTSLRPTLPSTEGEEASLLDQPATLEVSAVVVAEDHPDDLARFLRGLASHPFDGAWELIIVANASSFDVASPMEESSVGNTVVVSAQARLGWAEAMNLGLRHTRGRIAVLFDTSVEPLGEVLTPLLAAFEDSKVGVAGPWGVISRDLRHFEEAPPGEVDAIEGYCLAIRREVLRDVGLFDHRFRWYRNADLDLSFAARAAGWRAVETAPLPLERHEHRGWTSLPEAERDRVSKRNFYRFLKHWGDRRDLLLHPGPSPHHHD
jgi:GT2 family glycosyltransferase